MSFYDMGRSGGRAALGVQSVDWDMGAGRACSCAMWRCHGSRCRWVDRAPGLHWAGMRVHLQCDYVDLFFISHVCFLVQYEINGELGFPGVRYCAGGYERMEKTKGLRSVGGAIMVKETMKSEPGSQRLALT